MPNATDIVGYTYGADLYCPECIVRQVDRHCYYPSPPASVEYWLDRVAKAYSIDRDDESTFDSGDFPKVMFRSMVRATPPDYCEDTDRCGLCGKVLGE